MLKRFTILLYGVACYGIFLVTFLYALGFVGDFAVPVTLDGPPRLPLGRALLIDVLLLGIFAIQHSVMARTFFKRWLTRHIPESAERSTYVLFSSLALVALFYWWQPIGGIVWQATSPLAQGALLAGYAFGWGLLLLATFLIDHFDLFGLRQVALFAQGRP